MRLKKITFQKRMAKLVTSVEFRDSWCLHVSLAKKVDFCPKNAQCFLFSVPFVLIMFMTFSTEVFNNSTDLNSDENSSNMPAIMSSKCNS